MRGLDSRRAICWLPELGIRERAGKGRLVFEDLRNLQRRGRREENPFATSCFAAKKIPSEGIQYKEQSINGKIGSATGQLLFSANNGRHPQRSVKAMVFLWRED